MRRPGRAVLDWLDDRTGWRRARHLVLDEPLPPGTGWWFTLGSVLLSALLVQTVTGIALALFYAPTPDHAWDSIRYITNEVRGGAFLRGLHHWGASLMVVAAVLHMIRVVVMGSYRRPREVNWILGLVLLQLILAFGLTGYLLPWDQRAYWATVVTINIARLTPIAGDWVAAFLSGGPDIGALTLTRWYALHVLVLPVAMGALVAVHLALMRRHGISGPVRPRPGPSQAFFPYQAARDLTVVLVVLGLLAALAWRGAPPLERPADPTSSDYTPRPDWYFLGLFQLLKYFPGQLEVVGALVVPGLVMTWLALLPWIDRGRSRAWADRRGVLFTFALGVAVATALTVMGARDGATTTPPASVEWSVRELAGAALLETTDRCSACHGPNRAAAAITPGAISRPADWVDGHVADPLVLVPGLREPPPTDEADTAAIRAALGRLRSGVAPSIDPASREVIVLVNRHCLGCHAVGSVGGKTGPSLTNVGATVDEESMAQRIADPTQVDMSAEMPGFAGRLSADEIRAIARWLAARR